MVIAAVDPNKKDLKLLVKNLRMVYPGAEIIMFTDPKIAAEYIRETPIDVLFTETAMLELTGLGLQAVSEAVQPGILTVFVSATDSYMGEALKSRAQGYIVKPVTRDSIRESLSRSKFSEMRAAR